MICAVNQMWSFGPLLTLRSWCASDISNHSKRGIRVMHDRHKLAHSQRRPGEGRSVPAVEPVNLTVDNKHFPRKRRNMIDAAKPVHPPAFAPFRVVLSEANHREFRLGKNDFIDLHGSIHTLGKVCLNGVERLIKSVVFLDQRAIGQALHSEHVMVTWELIRADVTAEGDPRV